MAAVGRPAYRQPTDRAEGRQRAEHGARPIVRWTIISGAMAVLAAFPVMLAGAMFFDGTSAEGCTRDAAGTGCCRMLAEDEFAARLCDESGGVGGG